MTTRRFTIVTLLALMSLFAGCHGPAGRDFSGIEKIVQSQIDTGHFPGAVVLVGNSKKILYWKAFGHEVATPYQEEMTKGTLFDMASLTKPVATGTSIMTLVDQGRIDVNDYVKEYLPEFATGGKEKVQIKHLLTHTSGLPAYTSAKPIKEQYGCPCPDRVIEKICSFDALNEPGDKYRYSCLGYITLAKVLERITGQTVAQYSQEHIFKPLGMKHTTYNPPLKWQSKIAATEISDGILLRGTVHDPLAQLMDGVSGNAGLFSTARDLSVYCRMILNGGTYKGKRILSPEAVHLMTTEQSLTRTYGWGVIANYSWSEKTSVSEQAICHTGYTGTSIVIDPAAELYLIILTNRVHPDDTGIANDVRSKVAEIVFPLSK